MPEINFIIPEKAVGKGRPKFSTFIKRNGRQGVIAYTPSKTKIYETHVKNVAIEAMKSHKILTGAVFISIEIMVRPPASYIKSKNKEKLFLSGAIPLTKKPDLDNCIKAILDAMNKIVYLDDSQVVGLTAIKKYGEVSETKVSVRQLDA